ncbi:MAG: 4Fe-4S dicluster domain-containing protein [Planctomycetota bacterium]
MNHDDCSACGLCVAGCQAHVATGREELTAQGRNLALQAGVGRSDLEENIGACTLSGYCTAICPRGVDNEAVWLALRRQVAPHGALDALKRFQADGSLQGPLPPVEAKMGAPLFIGCHLRGEGHSLLLQLTRALGKAGLTLGYPSEEPCCGEVIRRMGFDQALPVSRPAYVLDAGCSRAFPGVPSLWDALFARPRLFGGLRGQRLHVSAPWLNADPRRRWPLLQELARLTDLSFPNVDAFHLAMGAPPETGSFVMDSTLVSADNPWLMEAVG